MKKLLLLIITTFFLGYLTITAQNTDSTHVETAITYSDSIKNLVKESEPIDDLTNTESNSTSETSSISDNQVSIIPNEGFSFTSLWRGVLGMISLIVIAFLFSSNRKAIDWKLVGIALSMQILFGLAVLKVEF